MRPVSPHLPIQLTWKYQSLCTAFLKAVSSLLLSFLRHSTLLSMSVRNLIL